MQCGMCRSRASEEDKRAPLQSAAVAQHVIDRQAVILYGPANYAQAFGLLVFLLLTLSAGSNGCGNDSRSNTAQDDAWWQARLSQLYVSNILVNLHTP